MNEPRLSNETCGFIIRANILSCCKYFSRLYSSQQTLEPPLACQLVIPNQVMVSHSVLCHCGLFDNIKVCCTISRHNLEHCHHTLPPLQHESPWHQVPSNGESRSLLMLQPTFQIDAATYCFDIPGLFHSTTHDNVIIFC